MFIGELEEGWRGVLDNWAPLGIHTHVSTTDQGLEAFQISRVVANKLDFVGRLKPKVIITCSDWTKSVF